MLRRFIVRVKLLTTGVAAKLLEVISCGRRSERFEELPQYHRGR